MPSTSEAHQNLTRTQSGSQIVKILRRTLVAAGVTVAVGLGAAGVAGAQTTTDYTPAVEAEVLGTQQTQAAAVSASGTLPYTGSDSLPLAEIGAGLLAAGGLTVVMVRRHQAQAEA
jgi:LPXTG-motif cell wall-anchored protein